MSELATIALLIKEGFRSVFGEILGLKGRGNLVTVAYKAVTVPGPTTSREAYQLYTNKTRNRQILHIKFVGTGLGLPVYFSNAYINPQLGAAVFPVRIDAWPVWSMETVDLIVDSGVTVYFSQFVTGPTGHLYYMTEPF